MRAGELIGCEVFDRHGVRIGRVLDLRLVAGPHRSGLSGYYLDGLITGAGPAVARAGRGQRATTGPRLRPPHLALRRRVLVPWLSVATVEGGLIRLRVDAATLVGHEARR